MEEIWCIPIRIRELTNTAYDRACIGRAWREWLWRWAPRHSMYAEITETSAYQQDKHKGHDSELKSLNKTNEL